MPISDQRIARLKALGQQGAEVFSIKDKISVLEGEISEKQSEITQLQTKLRNARTKMEQDFGNV